jgi:hypothetical protein
MNSTETEVNNRCILCDYVEGHGNSYIITNQGFNKVQWDKQSAGYICYDCKKHSSMSFNTSFKVKDFHRLDPVFQASEKQAPMPTA